MGGKERKGRKRGRKEGKMEGRKTLRKGERKEGRTEGSVLVVLLVGAQSPSRDVGHASGPCWHCTDRQEVEGDGCRCSARLLF